MSSAALVQRNGFGAALWASMKARMSCSRCWGERCTPRRICFSVRLAKKRSTWLIHRWPGAFHPLPCAEHVRQLEVKARYPPDGGAADHDIDPRPAGADRLDQVPQHAGDFCTIGRLARPEDHRDRLADHRLADMDRQEAVTVVVGMEQGRLLAAVHPVDRIVDIEQTALRHLGEAAAEKLDHRRHHADERDLRRQVLQPRHRRLRAGFWPRLGQPPHRHLGGGIVPQGFVVAGVFIAGVDQQRPETDHLGQTVPYAFGCSWIGDAAGQPLNNLHFLNGLCVARQHQARP